MRQLSSNLAEGKAAPTVFDLLRIAWDERRRMAAAGELDAAHLFVAADGGQQYLEAMAKGDIATAEVAQLRAGMFCGHCQDHTITDTGMEVRGERVRKGWCGQPQTEAMGGRRPTCGCLVTLTVGSRVVAGPKAWVGSARCPQGFW